jgi:LCP family protein required for cell wall assembly
VPVMARPEALPMTAPRTRRESPSSVELDALLSSERDPEPRRPRAMRRALIGLLVCVIVLGLVLVGMMVHVQSRLSGQLARVDNVFTGLADRPARSTSGTAGDALNILVMGTDRRSEAATTGSAATGAEWVPGAQRTDTIMILHVDGDREGASLISIPRDAWVDVPGYGENKINAAFSFAGPSLAVQTIEDYTGVRIDHLAVIDWTGFETLTDALGGVTVTVPRTIQDTRHHVVWTKGEQRLDGSQALLYVRQRYGLPHGDFDRIRRQQAFLRSLMHSSITTLRGSNPKTAYDLLDATTRSISVDEGWSFDTMRDLTLDLRGISPRDVEFITAPVRGLGREGDQSVVYLDRAANRDLWSDVFDDRVDRWVERNGTAIAAGPVP